MILTHITISYSRTHSLGNYSNVKPSASLTVEIEETDDLNAVKAQLLSGVKTIVEAEIDAALEADDQPAKFSPEPRYRVLITSETLWLDGPRWGQGARKVKAPQRLAIIVPQAATIPQETASAWFGCVARDLRLAHALRRAASYADSDRQTIYEIIDCADGDLSRVPAWVWQPPEALLPPEPEPEPVTGDASYERYITGQEGVE